jgi:integrase
VREEQGDTPITTDPGKVLRLFSALSRWRGGVMVPHFAMLYFSGIRPEELKRMATRQASLVNRSTSTISVPANVSKTRHERQVTIPENLLKWLEAFPGSLLPTNYDRLAKMVRKHFGLTHDEPRHSFISYHVALNRSIGDAALQAGNSESIVKRHYLNTQTRAEGGQFFAIFPSAKGRGATLHAVENAVPAEHLKAI